MTPVSHKGAGKHDVNIEIRFDGRLELNFHDSMGFKGGSTEELDKVKDFVIGRSKETGLDKQLHMIW
jgi:hypothetical protein